MIIKILFCWDYIIYSTNMNIQMATYKVNSLLIITEACNVTNLSQCTSLVKVTGFCRGHLTRDVVNRSI